VVKGTVTISLADYEKLKNAEDNAETLDRNVKLLAKELQVFLTFVCTRADIDKYVQEFNLQSTTSKIIIEGGRAKIEKR
tara:strand:- start:1414 stop:1650 length:237 start_codon:yes stop_codon:yes gene_type:complete